MMNNKKSKCNKCNSFGFLKIDITVCKNCNGKICFLCENKGGIIKGPWKMCGLCNGSGYSIKKKK